MLPCVSFVSLACSYPLSDARLRSEIRPPAHAKNDRMSVNLNESVWGIERRVYFTSHQPQNETKAGLPLLKRISPVGAQELFDLVALVLPSSVFGDTGDHPIDSYTIREKLPHPGNLLVGFDHIDIGQTTV
jgi:hypothetical protein